MSDQSKGLGDDIAKVIKIVFPQNGKGECEGCKKRRERLNKMFPKKS